MFKSDIIPNVVKLLVKHMKKYLIISWLSCDLILLPILLVIPFHCLDSPGGYSLYKKDWKT